MSTDINEAFQKTVAALGNRILTGALGKARRNLKQYGELRPTHFQDVKSQLAALQKSPRSVLALQDSKDYTHFGGHQPQDRLINFQGIQMAPYDCEGVEYLGAVSAQLTLQSSFVIHCVRPYPLAVKREHLEYRHIKHTATVLEYDGEDMRRAIALAVPFACVLGAEVMQSPNKETIVPCAMPHSTGMLLGEAVLNPIPPINMHGLVVNNTEINDVRHQGLVVPAMILLNTFVSSTDLSKGEHALRQELLKVTQELAAPLDLASKAYRLGPWQTWGVQKNHATYLEQKNAWNFCINRIRGFVATSEAWKEDSEKQKENIARRRNKSTQPGSSSAPVVH